MSEKYLHRQEAPFGDEVWEGIDKTVVGAAKSKLSGRSILQIDGPYGVGLKTLASEDVQVEEKVVEGVCLCASCPAPIAMIQSSFTLGVRDIASYEQSKVPLELGAAARAAISCALQEDELIFNGSKVLKLEGLLNSKKSQSLKLGGWDEIGRAAKDIISAVTILDGAGFGGPYVLALSPKLYNLLFRIYPQGNATETEHIRQIASEGIIKSAAISEGGLVLNTGRQFASIVLGQDLMTGYVGLCGCSYEFNVIETVTLRLVRPEAICVLKQ